VSRASNRPIIVGSFNVKKATEMAELLRDLEVPVRPLADFPHVRPVPEDGETLGENARLKALGLVRQLATSELLGVVADDSGIEVDALDGRPGVRSARYAGEDATDPERVRLLLRELGDLPAAKRTARFRCHIAFADAERILLEADGAVEGRIAFAPAGSFGFGYDPIFIPVGYDKTFAQLGAEVKHSISHRAVALQSFRNKLTHWLDQPYQEGR